MRYGLELPAYEAGKPFEFEREMGYSREEFMRVARRLAKGAVVLDIDGVDGGVTIETTDGRLTIRVIEAFQRKLALMALPALRVRFTFEGMSERRIGQWFEVLERTFQRGGG